MRKSCRQFAPTARKDERRRLPLSRKAKKQKSRGVVDIDVLVAGISGFKLIGTEACISMSSCTKSKTTYHFRIPETAQSLSCSPNPESSNYTAPCMNGWTFYC